MISPNKLPALYNIKPKITLTMILLKARIAWPFLSRLSLSNIKVENVVKAPQNPIINKTRASGPRINFLSAKEAKIPRIKQPLTFTIKVP